jgi:hypothetical protein
MIGLRLGRALPVDPPVFLCFGLEGRQQEPGHKQSPQQLHTNCVSGESAALLAEPKHLNVLENGSSSKLNSLAEVAPKDVVFRKRQAEANLRRAAASRPRKHPIKVPPF